MGFGKDGMGTMITHASAITLGTLADGAAIKEAAGPAITEDFRLISFDIYGFLQGDTTDENVVLGLADDELSVAEIAEAVVNSGPLDRNDNVGNEQASRPVFLIQEFGQDGNGNATNMIPSLRKTIRWTFSAPEGWTLFALNHSGSALTTGAVFRFVGKYYGVWVS